MGLTVTPFFPGNRSAGNFSTILSILLTFPKYVQGKTVTVSHKTITILKTEMVLTKGPPNEPA